ncbi:HNH endonuclease [Halomonas sp. OfavH-34-E]|nr:HNH endonuclease [Halomonas sp. OfavH-34-E]
MTEEHVVPEFLGGSIKRKNTCKSCNSKMGNGFESVVEKSFIFQLFSYRYGVVKKSGASKNPLAGDYDVDGRKIEFGEDGEVKVKFTGFEEVENEDGVTVYSAILDESDIDMAKAALAKKIFRKGGGDGETISRGQAKKIAEKFISENEFKKESYRPHLSKRVEMDQKFFDSLVLLFVKVCYESLCLLDPGFLSERVPQQMRKSLDKHMLSKKIESNVRFMSDFPAVDDYLLDGQNYVIFLGQYCVMRLGPFNAIVILESSLEEPSFLASPGVKKSRHGDFTQFIAFLEENVVKNKHKSFAFPPPPFLS